MRGRRQRRWYAEEFGPARVRGHLGRHRLPVDHATAQLAPRPGLHGHRHPARPAPPPDGGATVPSGHHLVHDPAGFSVAVPDGFTREPQGERIFYMLPGEACRLGQGHRTGKRRPARGDAPRRPRGPGTNPGHHDGRVTATAHRGHPAALRDFTWDGFSAAEGPRHTYDPCWEQDGRMYDVWVSAPVGRVCEAKEHFDVAVGGFHAR
ncbi:hypothetical protein [Streptomyces sp. NPDC001292]|uniref:hypothetical protein n=1 Tax=Streptomyces sp. NPDC001292 TaxID=3364558 RepID=UPI00368E59FD